MFENRLSSMKIRCPGNPLDRYTSRREFLHVGLVGGLGLTLPQFLRQQAKGDQPLTAPAMMPLTSCLPAKANRISSGMVASSTPARTIE